MKNQDVTDWIRSYCANAEGNVIGPETAIDASVAGLKLFEEPLIGFGAADDPLFQAYKGREAVGPWFMAPEEWLPEARTVISFFMPFTREVKESNARSDRRETSLKWLHARAEGQRLTNVLAGALCAWMSGQGYPTVAPLLDPRLRLASGGEMPGYPEAGTEVFGSNWSERHAAYVCGLGSFGLSKGLITAKGVAGWFGSVITTALLVPDSRSYSGLYDYCTQCGACIINCPALAISKQTGKDHGICKDWMSITQRRYAPHYGCGKCQVGVPCESEIPNRALRG